MFKIKVIRTTSQYVGKIFVTRASTQFKIVKEHKDVDKVVLEEVNGKYRGKSFNYNLDTILERVETGEYTWKN